MSKKNLAILIVILSIIIDQISKIYIKTHFYLGEEIKVLGLNWFRIHFTENNGMAWGFELGGKAGKLFLTLFRIIAVIAFFYWLRNKIIKKSHNGVIIALSLILAGAVGNIIDSVFYGIIFDTPMGTGIASLFSENNYGSLFFGKVVDMFYFPIYKSNSFTFFNAIFNVADSCISIGIVLLFIFNDHVFSKKNK